MDIAQEIILKVLTTLFAAAIPAVVGILTAWVRSKLSLDNYEKLRSAVYVAVEACEQYSAMYGWSGEASKQWVIDKITTQFPAADAELIDTLIESAVASLKASGAELIGQNGSTVLKPSVEVEVQPQKVKK